MAFVSVYLGLGSNKGDRRKNIERALSMLDEGLGCHYTALSRLIETKAWGFKGDKFLNACVLYRIYRKGSPEEHGMEILGICKETDCELKSLPGMYQIVLGQVSVSDMKEVSIEDSTKQVEIFDTAIAVIASLMIIPAVFAFSHGDESMLNAGPSLMFITMPKIFASMGFGRIIGIAFFALVLFAAVTSAIALTESAVSTFADEFQWDRHRGVNIMAVIMFVLGSLSSLGYGPLADVTIIGMQFLDFFDFLTNSVMMPIAAFAICILVIKFMTVKKLEEEVEQEDHPFRRKAVFGFMINVLCPLFVVIILVSAILNVFGVISM